MDHLDISNSVDSTGAFRVVAAAAGDVSSCSVLSVWYAKRPLKELAKFPNFLFVFLAIASTFIYHHRKEKLSFFIYTR
jgi:hypothetical protein